MPRTKSGEFNQIAYQNEYNKIIISITYCVVVFSIVVQGLTIGKVANPKQIAKEEEILEEAHL